MTDLILHEDKPIMAAESNSIMESIMMLAKDKDFDAAKLKVMQEMMFAQEDRMKKQNFIESFIAAKKEIGFILRNTDNGGTNKKYANLESIANILNPVMEKYGFTMSFGTFSSKLENHVGVSARLMHEKGHWEDYYYDSPLDNMGSGGKRNKTDCQGSGSSLTYGQRYLTILIWNLITVEKLKEDNDGRNKIVQKITEQQAADLQALMDEVLVLYSTEDKKNAYKQKYFKHFGIESFSELPASNYKNAATTLINTRNKGA